MRSRGRGKAQRARQGRRPPPARWQAARVRVSAGGERAGRLRDRAEVNRRGHASPRRRGRAVEPGGRAGARVPPDPRRIPARRPLQCLFGAGAADLTALLARPAVRAGVLLAYVLLLEWTRALVATIPGAVVPALLLGGAGLVLAAWGWPAERLGLGTSRLGLRLVGGFALAAVLLLPAAARVSAVPILPGALAIAAIAVSIGEEVAFRGALFAALEDIGGAPAAVIGSTLAWTAAHALSHPAEFLPAVAAAGLLLAMWRLVFRDLVGPILAHAIADTAL
ncbi:MAG: CPBP family intramembrane metalloprotease [Chloroflexi bacterium]|nr:MAG: CPBP family intramembrane metalloprotease [Chloroflexota bacterium]